MADDRVYRVKLTPEQALERIRSCVGQCSYEVRVIGRSFYLNETDFLAPSLTGSVRDEEGVTCIDLRLSLHLVPMLIMFAFAMLVAQGLFYVIVGRNWSAITRSEVWEEAAGILAMVIIAAGLLRMAWRPRRLRAAAFWAFLDQLFTDVKIGEEQL